jgi:hypothetical protein
VGSIRQDGKRTGKIPARDFDEKKRDAECRCRFEFAHDVICSVVVVTFVLFAMSVRVIVC